MSEHRDDTQNIRHMLIEQRMGLKELGFMLVEDEHWELGTWTQAVAYASSLKALPRGFVVTIAEPLEELFARTEDDFVGVCATPANSEALLRSLAQVYTKFVRPRRNQRTGRVFTPIHLTVPIKKAIARVHPVLNPTATSPFAMKVEWRVRS